MFLQSGGGGKGIRPSQQQHQQNQHPHHQTTHHHHHQPLQQAHNTLSQQVQHQQQQQQQLQQVSQTQHHTVFIPQQSSANHSHLPLPHVQTHQQQTAQQTHHQQQQQQFHQQQISQQQQQQANQAQNQLQSQQLIFYANPPQPHPAQYATAPPTGANVVQHQTTVHMATGSSPVQVSSSTSLVGANNNSNGQITPSGSTTSIVRTISNSGLQHYTTSSSGLIQTQPSPAASGGATYMTTAYLPYNPTAVLTAAATAAVAFNANGNSGGPPSAPPTPTFYQTAQPPVHQQKQTLHHPTTQQPIAFYHTSNAATPANSSAGTHRQQMRNIVQASPPQQQNQRQNTTSQHSAPAFFAYAMPSGQQPRAGLMNNGATCTPILAPRSGHTTYLPPQFCAQPMAMGPPGTLAGPSHILAQTGLTSTPSGLQPFQTHLPPGAVNATLSAASLTGPASMSEKVKERKHAIPIIHPITHENVLDPKSSKTNKNPTPTTTKSTTVENIAEFDTLTLAPESITSPITSTTGTKIPEAKEPNSVSVCDELKVLETLSSSFDDSTKIDQQMQTDKQSNAKPNSIAVFMNSEIEQSEPVKPLPEKSSTTNDVPGNLATDNQVTVIVKDIIASSSEERLSFFSPQHNWNYNEEKPVERYLKITPGNGTNFRSEKGQFHNTKSENETQSTVVEETKTTIENLRTVQHQQRPKSANKQNTATPISIANAVAEAATGSATTLTAKSQQQKLSKLISTATSPPTVPLVFESIASTTSFTTTVNVQASLTVRNQQKQTAGKKLDKQKQTPVSSGASSSTASTPTHQQQQKKTTGKFTTMTNNNNIGGTGNNGGSKKSRKAQKRAKENQKKQKGLALTSNNNRNLLSNYNNNAVSLSMTDAVAKINQTESNSASSNSCSLSSNIRETSITRHIQHDQPISKQTQISGTSSSINKARGVRILPRVDSTTDDTLSTSTTESLNSTNQIDKHMATEDIVTKFLLASTPNNKPHDGQQLQFLNSFSTGYEDDDILKPIKHAMSEDSSSSVGELKFGDFSEDKDNSDQTIINTSTWTSSLSTSTTSTVSSVTTISTTTKETKQKSAMDVIDCSSRSNSVTSKSSIRSSNSVSVQKLDIRPPPVVIVRGTDPHRRIKYTLEELKEMSKLSESRKPPMVPCQKGDCISQLFVSRQQHHHGHSQSAIGLHQHLHQQYQHMNFNESMDFVSGKRRGQNKKHHDQQIGGGNNANGGSGGSGQRSMDIIRVHLSLKEEIKLSECENAWQPETLRRMSVQNVSYEDDDLETVLKKVRGILNKLTPDNFDVLLKTMSCISMNTYEKMQQVMLLIFEKTVSEPSFAPTYAKFCKVLFHEIKAENKSLFTSSLITRIQHEFESNVNDANAKALKLQPLVERLENCSDVNKRAELQAELEDQEYQFRRRAWGTVRFIGELFKLQSLTSDRVLNCIESLLEHGCEEKLEYMCKLLTTVGRLLEGTAPEQSDNKVRFDEIFRKIQEIVNKSRSIGYKPPTIKISSRVRFMMQDVMDLRARNWDQPTGHSYHTARHRNVAPGNTKHEDKSHGRIGAGSLVGNSNQHQQQRHMTSNRHSDSHDSGNYFLQKLQKTQQHDHPSLSIDLTKLRFSSGDDTTQSKLGNSSNYIWRNISNRPLTSTSGSVGMLKRPITNQACHASAFSSMQSSSASKSIISTINHGSCSNSNSSVDVVVDSFSSKECQEMLNRLTEEALNARDWQDEILVIWRTCNIKQQIAVFHYLLVDYLHLCTVKRQHRLAIANVFTHLMLQKAFDKSSFMQVYDRFAEEFPDLLVDVPNGWTYVFEFLGPIMHERLLHFNDIWQRQWLDDSYFTERFVKAFLNYFTTEFGAKYTRELWLKEYKLDRGQTFWKDVSKFREFINSHGFNFIDQNSKQMHHHHHQLQQRLQTTPPHNTAEQVERIKHLLNVANDSDMAIDYINTNVNINTKFIRQLTKFLCCDYALTVMSNKGVSKPQMNPQLFRRKCTPLLRLCLDTREAHEIACLDEIAVSLQQYFLLENDDKSAANEIICNIFTILYDCEVIPKESFEKWYKTELDQGSSSHHSPGNSTNHRPLTDELRVFMEKLL